MLKGKGLMLTHPASNPIYLASRLDYYAVDFVAFNVDDEVAEQEGRLLTPGYVLDLRANYNGEVYAYGTRYPKDTFDVCEWLNLNYLFLYMGHLNTPENQVIHTQSLLTRSYPINNGPIAYYFAEVLLEHTDLPRDEVQRISDWFRDVVV